MYSSISATNVNTGRFKRRGKMYARVLNELWGHGTLRVPMAAEFSF